MKSLILFFCLNPFLGLSQTSLPDTTKIALPIRVARDVVKDIVSGDSAKAVLVLTEQQLRKTENLVSAKDSIITNLGLKIVNYKDQIILAKQKGNIYQLQYEEQRKDNKELSRKLKFNNFLHYLIMGGLVSLYLTK